MAAAQSYVADAVFKDKDLPYGGKVKPDATVVTPMPITGPGQLKIRVIQQPYRSRPDYSQSRYRFVQPGVGRGDFWDWKDIEGGKSFQQGKQVRNYIDGVDRLYTRTIAVKEPRTNMVFEIYAPTTHNGDGSGHQYAESIHAEVTFIPASGTIGASNSSTPAEPKDISNKTTRLLVETWNTESCQLTDTARFELKEKTFVTHLNTWIDGNRSGGRFSGTLKGPGGISITISSISGGNQWQWREETMNLDRELPAGKYVLKSTKSCIAQNKRSSGNGFIKVYGK